MTTGIGDHYRSLAGGGGVGGRDGRATKADHRLRGNVSTDMGTRVHPPAGMATPDLQVGVRSAERALRVFCYQDGVISV